jgi:hypothetical protein
VTIPKVFEESGVDPNGITGIGTDFLHDAAHRRSGSAALKETIAFHYSSRGLQGLRETGRTNSSQGDEHESQRDPKSH